MKILVIGATGYIGSAVAARLLEAGHEVRGFARSAESAGRLGAVGIEPFHGSLQSQSDLRAAAADPVGCIIHIASTADGVEPLLATGPRFIYTSGIWVLGDTPHRVAEDAPYNPPGIVAWRPEVEQSVVTKSGAVIRPGIVYGAGGSIPAMLTASAKEAGTVKFVGSGANHWPVVHLDDLADLYLLLIDHATPGSVWNAVSEEMVTVREAARAAAEGQRIPGKIESWPVEDARKKLGGFADALCLDQRISAAKAHKLGWKPHRASLIEDLKRGSYAA